MVIDKVVTEDQKLFTVHKNGRNTKDFIVNTIRGKHVQASLEPGIKNFMTRHNLKNGARKRAHGVWKTGLNQSTCIGYIVRTKKSNHEIKSGACARQEGN